MDISKLDHDTQSIIQATCIELNVDTATAIQILVEFGLIQLIGSVDLRKQMLAKNQFGKMLNERPEIVKLGRSLSDVWHL